MTNGWQQTAAKLEPVVFRRFLRARGWQEHSSDNHARWLFTRSLAVGPVEVEIPTDSRLADYQRRIAEAVEILAIVENTSPAELVASLSSGNTDIIHFRFASEAFADGNIPLEDALQLRLSRKNLLLAAAHSVVEPLPHFARLSRAEPTAFLASCREAPARTGSYVSSVLIPVSPTIGQMSLDAPFSRRVTELLARALRLAADTLTRGDDDALLNHVAAGLSANFLSALANLAPPGGRGVLDIDFSWSPARPPPDLPSTHIRFADAVFPALGEAARVLRETEPMTGYELEGYVIRLERMTDASDQPGQVVIAAAIEDRPGTSKVHVVLPPAMYQQAIDAHASGAIVRVSGTLGRQGRRFVLENPGGLTVHPDPE